MSWHDGLEFLDERRGIGHDFDVEGPAVPKEDRYARRADLMGADCGAEKKRDDNGTQREALAP